MTAELFENIMLPPIDKKEGYEYFAGVDIHRICEERSKLTVCVISRSSDMPPLNEVLVCEYFYFIEQPKENKQVEKFIAQLSNYYNCAVLTDINKNNL